ncbi:DUF4166 domain-containing protein [Sphingomonas flavescens]|uniref:DUF4166 domain-containing protein n=1 Tax=Sphingomonas flavescens TaxID=3132797 RepID=UPI0028040084|nr:DUF4166 domain-containing protein [Sphingomonas limnosediminicola]
MTLAPVSLYERLLGDRFSSLPRAVTSMHAIDDERVAVGDGFVVTNGGLSGSLIRKVMKLPPAGHYQLEVRFFVRDGMEIWTRRFGDFRFTSRLSAVDGKLAERFGPLRLRFDLSPDANGLRMALASWDVLGLPMPEFLAPRIAAGEWAEDDWFCFEVCAALPLVGPVIRYSGRLTLQPVGGRA